MNFLMSLTNQEFLNYSIFMLCCYPTISLSRYWFFALLSSITFLAGMAHGHGQFLVLTWVKRKGNDCPLYSRCPICYFLFPIFLIFFLINQAKEKRFFSKFSFLFSSLLFKNQTKPWVNNYFVRIVSDSLGMVVLKFDRSSSSPSKEK